MSFFGLNIAVSGLRAQQIAMNVTAHNIANAGVEGYHRQEAVLVAGNPLLGAFTSSGNGSAELGTGVLIHSIRRMQSSYVDNQIRSTYNWLGSWTYKNDTLQQVESVLSEPGEFGLSASFDKFWSAWQELSVPPQSHSAKISVVQTGVALSHKIRNLYTDLRGIQARADQDLVENADQINRIAHDIAKLNEQIRVSSASGNSASDLLDQRDILLDQLSNIVKIQTNNTTNPELIVSIGGKALVQGDKVVEITVTEDAHGWSELCWSDDGSKVLVTGGQIAGQIDVRDNIIGFYIERLNTIVTKFVDAVNELHSSGITFDGEPAGDFFVSGSDASNIMVNPDLVDMPTRVATSTSGNPGANDIAIAIAALKDEKIMGGDESISSAYRSLVSRIGSDAREARSRAETHHLSLQQLKTQRESVSGVSLDEEMANMVKFQQSYNAAARIFTAIDEMLETVVSRMGVVGR